MVERCWQSVELGRRRAAADSRESAKSNASQAKEKVTQRKGQAAE